MIFWRDIILLMAFIGSLACGILAVMFARVYMRSPVTTSARFLAIIFAGITVGFLSNVLSAIANFGSPCAAPISYYIRAIGLAIATTCVLYSGFKLAFLDKVKVKK